MRTLKLKSYLLPGAPEFTLHTIRLPEEPLERDKHRAVELVTAINERIRDGAAITLLTDEQLTFDDTDCVGGSDDDSGDDDETDNGNAAKFNALVARVTTLEAQVKSLEARQLSFAIPQGNATGTATWGWNETTFTHLAK